MPDAIIGSTGFVGSNLLAAHDFSGRFNSRNIGDIAGTRFDLCVCAAAPAAMWAANRDPEADWRNIEGLIRHLEQMRAGRMVLVSTIAVLGNSCGLDESTDCFEAEKAYGRHRRLLEEACQALFAQCHVLRLPALFGPGLKKNFLFDIAHRLPSFFPAARFGQLQSALSGTVRELLERAFPLDAPSGLHHCQRDALSPEETTVLSDALEEAGASSLDLTHADSTYQFYGLTRLWQDMQLAIELDLPLVHLAPEPLRAGEVYRALTGKPFEKRAAGIYREDMRTQHSAAWHGPAGYMQNGTEVLRDLQQFWRGWAGA